ncbi:hypothetical protein [uncultured Gilvimarinus sp.]|uniref:hypothetical protein n=1 Tax=uncultured Gilvimarinus sp. TaxID=1689143 RepID=UPI0030EE0B2B|tara:strand:+ start:675 stop:1331 length:657 start_codon:yes stop_codon:yes gene_type:complete
MSSAADQSLKRRIVFTALADYLSGEPLMQALNLWEAQYAAKPVYALNEFVGKLAQYPAIAGKRKEVIRTLLSLSQNPVGLLPEPNPLHTSYKAPETQVQAAYPERLDKVFEHFLVALEVVMPSAEYGKLRLSFLLRLDEMSLNPTLKACLRRWFESDGSDKAFAVVCSAAEIRRVVNQLYVALCEQCGPVQADDTLEATVVWLERKHPACVRDIRRFL